MSKLFIIGFKDLRIMFRTIRATLGGEGNGR